MRRTKSDAADILCNELLAAVRKYKAAKDAPERARQAGLLPSALDELSDGGWHCPHVARCDNREKCKMSSMLGRPKRGAA